LEDKEMIKLFLTTFGLGLLGAYGIGYLMTFLGIVSVTASVIAGTFFGLAVAALYMIPAWASLSGVKLVGGSGISKVS
jgi:hypothetical protein